ncbi:family 20 glycosylhydrolase [Microbacterium sp. zg.Y1084]|uniref:family 20 glycosylhydrolase n=1 Tax=Microbacterium sp. zg.Y1084 TaxID=2969667 RepID=UPI00214BE30B|nr:family 20 glycosylhydrolase [Microbacterium sp. zg.Y1084]MCR2812311.1 family 20 glycosylhydrolase [Microbacterium sp. zg.Y1084]
MKSPTERRSRRLPTVLTATMTAVAFALSSLVATAPAVASALDPGPVELPSVIPSIEQWQQSGGSFGAADDLAVVVATESERLESIAGILREELAVDYAGVSVTAGPGAAGDIVLRLDEGRTDLETEGYELKVGDRIEIVAADPAGVFYGTRTVVQMLMQQDTLPQGSLIDVPEYEERGVTVCACVINISTEFMDRLIEEMAFLKLNTMLVELKVKVDAYPETNTWSYYTKDDITALVAKAGAYGIDVIPEINSPGHMEIWLENKPELQLTNERTGAKDEVRMDITKPESFEFYADLIDEYFDVFTTEYWHMGVDEYMLGSGYANFPQVKRFAEAEFGAGATENDVVAWYVNKVNDYVKSKDKKLRIWNDGVITDNQFVDFDTDIIVEHWNPAASTVKPQQFIDWGHQVANISNSLYMVRGGYGVNSQRLYEQGWTPEVFYDQTVTRGTDQILGARMSIWPDGGTPSEAENTTEARMFEPLRFVAQATWSASRPWATFAEFRADMDTIGRAPLWDEVQRQPLPDGTFTLTGAAGEGALAAGEDGGLVLSDAGAPLAFTRTADGYYTIRSTDGLCLDLARDGTMRLDVPVEIGADIRLSTCATTTLQKWQLRKVDGGYTIVNAASQQFVSVSRSLVDVPVAREGFKTVADGRVVQTPGDWGKTVWKVVGDVAMTATPTALSAVPGTSGDVAVTVTNMAGSVLEGATVRVASAAAGWTALPASVPLEPLAPGEMGEAAFVLHNVNSASGTGTFVFELVGADGTVLTQTAVSTVGVCSAETVRPSAAVASSEQSSGEPRPSGPASAVIDGDPATYWHSQYSPVEPRHPHSVVIDLGADESVCGLWYTARSGGAGTGAANGRIDEYDVYVSSTVATVNGDWGEPVVSGAFQNTADAQLAAFPAQEARYIKLVSRSAINGQPWATIGELAAAGPAAAIPVFDEAEIDLSAASVQAGGEVAVSGTGFAPGEAVSFTLGQPVATMSRAAAAASLLELSADAGGAFSGVVVIPPATAAGTYVLAAVGAVSAAQASGTLAVTAAPARPGDVPAAPVQPGDLPAVPGAGGGGGAEATDPESAGSLANTGGELAVAGGIATGVLLLIIGIGLALLRRRRAVQAS